MDINKILRSRGYGGNIFGEIARQASQMSWDSEDQLIDWVQETYGPGEKKIEMMINARPCNLFLSSELQTDYAAIEQLYTALKLPVAIRGAALPDLHKGYSLPIGGVVALDNAISPAFVGYDIGCQVHLTTYRDNIDASEVKQQAMDAILKSTSFGLGAEMGADSSVMYDPLWRHIPILRAHYDLARKQLGSSGGGNHFADFVKVNYDTGVSRVGLMTHSGSRGIGNKVGHHYAALAEKETAIQFSVPKGYGWFDIHTELGQEYLAVMNLMVRYADACHRIIHKKFETETGLTQFSKVISVHNTAVATQEMVIHRKGAIEAQKGQYGVIPGSSGSFSYMVIGRGSERSLFSASHGAGRPHSRTKAKELHNPQAFEKRMKDLEILYHGVAPDETYQAYKDIDQVIEAQNELVYVAASIQPLAVVMGGNSDDGD